MQSIHTLLRQCFFVVATIGLVSLAGCDDEDPPLADNVVQFDAAELGFGADEDDLTVNISLSRTATEDTNITLATELAGVTYDEEFITEPAMTGNTLVVPVSKGSDVASFIIRKKEGVLLDGDEQVSFAISNAGTLVAGSKTALVVRFSEIVATEGVVNPNVGGQLQPNKVFIDLSANRQVSFNRGDWDLGFYTVGDEFRVIVNSSSAMMVRPTEKNDMNAVSEADTVGWGAQLSTDGVFAAMISGAPPAWLPDAIDWIDDPSGDMSKTAIAEISVNADDNKVYIINRGKNPDGNERGWKKVRVLRNGNNYTLQHADINATTFTTVEVTRNDSYYFNYVKFETGAVTIEPEKNKWDIAFTVFTNTTSLGGGITVPYVFNDIVIQNRYKVETAEVLIADVGAYADFEAAGLDGVIFSQNQVNIGPNWRSGGGPSSSPALRSDRFYLVKDPDGNIYKLQFTALTQGGERGRPQFEFALVQAAE